MAGTGDCKCNPGFDGENCNKCAPGFFGNKCEGTYIFILIYIYIFIYFYNTIQFVFTIYLLTECKCGNGICNEQGICSCNAGFFLDVNNQCIECKKGYYKSGKDCKPCTQGCESCEAETGKCTQCPPGHIYGDVDDVCSPNNQKCSPTQFFNENTQSCEACNPICGSCFGPTEKECLTCQQSNFYMEGLCIEPNLSDGRCSTSEAFYANNTRKICEACPSSCLDCLVPNFNILSTSGDIQCTKCMPGFVLDNGRCVEKCSEGKYADQTDYVCKGKKF